MRGYPLRRERKSVNSSDLVELADTSIPSAEYLESTGYVSSVASPQSLTSLAKIPNNSPRPVLAQGLGLFQHKFGGLCVYVMGQTHIDLPLNQYH